MLFKTLSLPIWSAVWNCMKNRCESPRRIMMSWCSIYLTIQAFLVDIRWTFSFVWLSFFKQPMEKPFAIFLKKTSDVNFQNISWYSILESWHGQGPAILTSMSIVATCGIVSPSPCSGTQANQQTDKETPKKYPFDPNNFSKC